MHEDKRCPIWQDAVMALIQEQRCEAPYAGVCMHLIQYCRGHDPIKSAQPGIEMVSP